MQPVKDRFRGALLGALIGDCMGAYWETAPWIGTHSIEEVKGKIRDQVERALAGKTPRLSYTDDTALTFAMAESLVECKKYNDVAMAKKFTETFFADVHRGYGGSVGTVFSKLRETNYTDAYGPASEQFEGRGSYGNGSGMRTSPGALLGCKKEETLFEVCAGTAKITHSHPSAVNGALLQAMAVKMALFSKLPLNPVVFLDALIKTMEPFESTDKAPPEGSEGNGVEGDSQPSCLQKLLSCLHSYIKCGLFYLLTRDRQLMWCSILWVMELKLASCIVYMFEAIPCAVYAFLHCCDKSFEELIPYAISLGGDTDTIASMAGAIGGAFWGEEGIPKDWIKSCESFEKAQGLADQLFDIVEPSSVPVESSSVPVESSSVPVESSSVHMD
ncbi:hypothetical protein EMCRGX_G029566 [Ephydatia muelleri]